MSYEPKSGQNPLVSVVIPAYNRADTIRDCLSSLRAQTYPNWEAIAVDDGSTDGTADLAEEMGRENANIRVIRQRRNRGAQAARNVGIRSSRGEWIAFLDSDDQFLPESIELRMALAQREAVEVVHSECYVVRTDAVMSHYGVPPLKGQIYSKLLVSVGPVFPTLLVSKAALQRIGYLDERIVAFQEWDTVIRLAQFYSFGFETKPTFVYNCRNEGTISKDFVLNGRGYEQVFRKHLFSVLRHAGPRALAKHYRVAAVWYEGGRDQKAVRRCRRMALMWSSLDPRTGLGKVRQVLLPQGTN